MNLKDVKELIKLFEKAAVTEMELEEGETRLYLSKNINTAAVPVQYQSASAPVPLGIFPAPQTPELPESAPKEAGNRIESPVIGTYYCAATPGGTPFVKVGDVVEKGETLCIIEAMKIMNAIEAEYRMKILKILLENGNPVEFGQTIFIAEEA